MTPESASPLRDLSALLHALQPERQPGCQAWCLLAPGSTVPEVALASFREAEGLSVIVPEAEAVSQGWPVQFRSAWITLRVHSALEAVGLTAAVSTALAQADIACNVVAGVHHDHLFVPIEQADQALATLQTLTPT
ncbi:MAG: ACT domain-containing protein [Lysobacterales bacterium]